MPIIGFYVEFYIVAESDNKNYNNVKNHSSFFISKF